MKRSRFNEIKSAPFLNAKNLKMEENLKYQRIESKSPSDISFKEWWQILLKVKNEIAADNLTIIAAGVSFYTFLAIFPTLISIISVYGWVMEPVQVAKQLEEMARLLPSKAYSIIEERILKLTETPNDTLEWASILSFLFVLWSANAGIKALFMGINIAYNTKQKRSFFKLNFIGLLFTLGSMIIAFLCMAFIVGLPTFADNLGMQESLLFLVKWFSWIVLAIVVFFWFSVVYKFAPVRKHATLKWVRPGAITATVLWIISSLGFSFYVSNFGNYDATYGSISAVVILLFWLFITNFIILLGAEINSEAEQRILQKA